MKKANKDQERKYHMNEKLRLRYSKVKADLLDLEEDTTNTVTSQLRELAKETGRGISSVERLKDALLDEADLLEDASEIFSRMHTSTRQSADEIKTRIKEAEQYEKESDAKHRLFKPNPTNAMIDYAEDSTNHFARGNTFYKLFWIFFIGCFAGVIIEMIWCFIRTGHIENRVGLIWGPFNLVYGLGALALSYCLYKYRNRSPFYSFAGGFVVGSIIEYFCSLFQEMVFGSTSWDYSHMPFNIDGRICLLYSIFWGILGVLWIKEIYPRLGRSILKIPNKVGKGLTWALLVFMLIDSLASGLVVYRWSKRVEGIAPQNSLERIIDQSYPDKTMEWLFPNLEFKASDNT